MKKLYKNHLAVEILGAKTAMPIHWGAFSLAYHAWDDPAQRFTAAAENQGLTVVTPKIGKTMRLENAKDFQIRWWENVE
jgi:L-ascorbate metabolism protein UlaG (beta-lactamase superfamily)